MKFIILDFIMKIMYTSYVHNYMEKKMRKVNVTELRNHLHRYLDSVKKGTEVLVTWHGEIIARILPPVNKKADALKQLKELRIRSNMRDVVSPLDEDWEVND
jgi:prevent-host-death family protein